MLIDCDALSPTRWNSQLFLAVYHRFTPTDLTRDQAWQLAVLLRTPGFTIDHHRTIFDWSPNLSPHIDTVTSYFRDDPNIPRAAADNAASITQADGLNILRAMLETNPDYQGTVPLWTQLALVGLRSDLQSNDELRPLFNNISNHRLRRWRQQQVFDPLTGIPYAQPR